MIIQILTLFPEMFTPVTQQSILGRAVDKKILDIEVVDIRDYSLDKHKKTDDTPYGGGPGMVMNAQPIFEAMRAIKAKGAKTIYLSPKGKLLDKKMIYDLASLDRLVLMCGHYEGVDQRVLDYWEMEEVSIGDYILTGGELPAMVLVDSVARLIPGVIGSEESHEEESIYSGLLEYPQYTKPRDFEGLQVPEVLTSGHHAEIDLWRFEQALLLTAQRRPDLLEDFLKGNKDFTKKEKAIIDKVLLLVDKENHGT